MESQTYEEIKKEKEYFYNLLLYFLKHIKNADEHSSVDFFTTEAMQAVLKLGENQHKKINLDFLNAMGK